MTIFDIATAFMLGIGAAFLFHMTLLAWGKAAFNAEQGRGFLWWGALASVLGCVFGGWCWFGVVMVAHIVTRPT